MPFLGVKLSEADQKMLEEGAMKSGKTLSDYIRDLIRSDHEKKSFAELLQEFKEQYSRETVALMQEFKVISARVSASQSGSGQSRELEEIKRIISLIDKRSAEQHRIITLLGQASPFVSRQLGQQ